MTRFIPLIKKNWVAISGTALVVITILSLLPLKELPSVPGNDKIHHYIAYAFLMFPVALRKPGKWLLLAIGFIAYSGVIELVQPYVNRYCEWQDLMVNIAGVVCGMVLGVAVDHLFGSKGKKLAADK